MDEMGKKNGMSHLKNKENNINLCLQYTAI